MEPTYNGVQMVYSQRIIPEKDKDDIDQYAASKCPVNMHYLSMY